MPPFPDHSQIIQEIERILESNPLSLERFQLRLDIARRLHDQEENRYALYCELYSFDERDRAHVNNRLTLEKICQSWRTGELGALVDGKHFLASTLAGISSEAMAALIATGKWSDLTESLRKPNTVQRYKSFATYLRDRNHPKVEWTRFQYADRHREKLSQNLPESILAFANAMYESLPRRSSRPGEVTAIDFTELPYKCSGKKTYLLFAIDIFSKIIRGAFLIFRRPNADDVLSLLECLRCLEMVRFDLGCEFENNKVRYSLYIRGICCEPIGPHLPQLNGAIESRNGKLKDKMEEKEDASAEWIRDEVLRVILESRNKFQRGLSATPKAKAGNTFAYDVPLEEMV